MGCPHGWTPRLLNGFSTADANLLDGAYLSYALLALIKTQGEASQPNEELFVGSECHRINKQNQPASRNLLELYTPPLLSYPRSPSLPGKHYS